jgi:hypothetical protein
MSPRSPQEEEEEEEEEEKEEQEQEQEQVQVQIQELQAKVQDLDPEKAPHSEARGRRETGQGLERCCGKARAGWRRRKAGLGGGGG